MARDADSELTRILGLQNEQLAGVKDTLARQERAFERQGAAFERQGAAFERQGAAFERQERAWAFQVQTFENLIAVTERMIVRLDDMGAQIRANTQAVLSALDRLDGPRPSEGG